MLKTQKEIDRNHKENETKLELRVTELTDEERKIIQKELLTAMRKIRYRRKKNGIAPPIYRYRIKG